MPWCPKCRYEYVPGIKVCPDCKEALVDSLDEISDETENIEELSDIYAEEASEEPDGFEEELANNETLKSIVETLRSKGLSDDDIKNVIQSAQMRAMSSKGGRYDCIKDKAEENKSATGILLVCGIAGVIVMLLNAFGVIHLPLSGFSFVLTYIVMGILFAIFIFSGIKSHLTYKRLLPEVKREEERIKKVIDFLKNEYDEGRFNIPGAGFSMEEESLIIYNTAIKDVESAFDNLKPGFAAFVLDNYYSDIFESDED